MTTAAAKLYDPFQPAVISPGASNTTGPAETKNAQIPDTARHYAERYWFAPPLPDGQLRHSVSLKSVSTETTGGEAPTIGNSTFIVGNLGPMTSPQPAPPSVFFRTSTYAQTRARFEVLQKWEGIVLEVLDDSLTARLIDLTRQGPDEEVEFALEEIDTSDRDLLKPGAVFYWNIGYADCPTGRARVSIIRFRRLPIWRPEELERAAREAKRLSGLLEWK